MSSEATNLISQIGKIAGAANYNGTTLLTAHTNGASTFQVGASNNANDQVAVDFSNGFDATSLSINALTVATLTDAQAAITSLDTAMTEITTNRAAFGAAVNQLSYVSANLSSILEQLSSAISTIRDADMAAEMADFTKSQVLVQAGTAMLAQANQSSQNVLSLFR